MPRVVWADAAGARIRILVYEGDDCGTVVFIHGLGGRAESWHRQARHVEGQGYTGIALDLRGFGASPRPATPPTLDDFTLDVATALDSIGAESAHVVGSSMGGLVALKFYALQPYRVESLLLADTYYRLQPRVELLRRAARGDRAALEVLARGITPPGGRLDDAIRYLASQDLEYMALVAEAISREDLSWVLSLVRVPVTVAVGEHDVLTPPEAARELASRISGARLAVVPGAGHLSHIDRPDAFNRILDEHLSWAGSCGRPS